MAKKAEESKKTEETPLNSVAQTDESKSDSSEKSAAKKETPPRTSTADAGIPKATSSKKATETPKKQKQKTEVPPTPNQVTAPDATASVNSALSKGVPHKSVETAKIEPKVDLPTLPTGDILEPGRAVSHVPFHDGRVRRISALDEPEHGNQHHYMLEVQETSEGIVKKVLREDLEFQKGPIRESAPNGWMEIDLIKILIDRIQNFDKFGDAQPENEQVLKGLNKAHEALEKVRKRKLEEREKALAAERKARASAPKPPIY